MLHNVSHIFDGGQVRLATCLLRDQSAVRQAEHFPAGIGRYIPKQKNHLDSTIIVLKPECGFQH